MTHYLSRTASRALVLLLMLVVSGAVLFRTSQNVRSAEEKLAALDRQIEAEQERITVLRAEWAHLNTPYRLEVLAQDALGLQGRAASSVVLYDDVIPQPLPKDTQQAKPIVFTSEWDAANENGGGR